MTPRIPPKNQNQFSPGNVIRLEFPAQGYVNPGKTTLEFDVTIDYDLYDTDFSTVRFQNNIQSLFSRVRLLYGATPLEDIPNYNVIVRCLTEWTGTNDFGANQFSITDGIAQVGPTVSGALTAVNTGAAASQPLIGNLRQKYVQGIDMRGVAADASGLSGFGVVPNGTVNPSGGTLTNHATIKGQKPTRRYQVQLLLGIMNQEKLIPTKFMASQLAIEITLANPSECMIYKQFGTTVAKPPTYLVQDMNLIPEILEFDASYDESFLRGLQSGGVPIKFSTWNYFNFSNGSGASTNLQIQERSRSVKAIFCMQRRATAQIENDSGACFFNTDLATADGASTLQDFQFRIGGRFLC